MASGRSTDRLSAAGPSTVPTGEDSQQDPFSAADWALFLAISMIWGSSFLLIAESLEALTPGVVTLFRVGGGALTLLVIRALSSGSGPSITARDNLRIALMALLWIVIPFSLFPLAQEHINSALTGLLNGATPVFVALFSLLMTGTRARGGLLLGLGLGFVGVVILSLPSIGEGGNELSGVLMVIGATVCYGVAFNLAAPLQARYGAVALMTPMLTMASIPLIPLGLRNWEDNTWELRPVLAVLVLGVVGTGLAYWVMSTLVGQVGVVRASFITYLIPVVSLILGVVIRGDDVAALALVGAAIITFGALLASGRIRLPGLR